ncbi:MAG: hypothetical protein SOZ52_03800 [Pyramidobacter sp.]|nr:hypothetical protein [Pyramidobacter sp.]
MTQNIEDPKMNTPECEKKKKVSFAAVESKVKGWSQKAASGTVAGLKRLAPDDFHEEISSIKGGVSSLKGKFVKKENTVPADGPIPVDQLPQAPLKTRMLQTGQIFKKAITETIEAKREQKGTPRPVKKRVEEPAPQPAPSADEPVSSRASEAAARGRAAFAKSAEKTKCMIQAAKTKFSSLSGAETKAAGASFVKDAKDALKDSAKGIAMGLSAARGTLEKNPAVRTVFDKVEKGTQRVSSHLKGSESLAKMKKNVSAAASSAVSGIKKAANSTSGQISKMKEKAAEKTARSADSSESPRPGVGSKMKEWGAKTAQGLKQQGEKLKGIGQSAKEKIITKAESTETAEHDSESFAGKLKNLSGKVSGGARGFVEKTRERAERFMDPEETSENAPSLGDKFKGLGEKIRKGAKDIAENAKTKAEALRRSEKGQNAEAAVKEAVKDVLPAEVIIDVEPAEPASDEEQYAVSETIDASIMGIDEEIAVEVVSAEDAESAAADEQKNGEQKNENGKKRRHH